MNELLYYFSNALELLFIFTSVILAVRFSSHMKDFFMGAFVFCLVGIFIIAAIDTIFDMHLHEYSCGRYEITHKIISYGDLK